MNKMPAKGEDGFSYVKYKGRNKNTFKQPASIPTVNPLDNLHTIITNIRDELKLSDFMTDFQKDLKNVLQEWNSENSVTDILNCDSLNKSDDHLQLDNKEQIDIICYGLGQFSSCMIARYQLGFLLVLKNILQCENVYIYDPQFSSEERHFLSELYLNVLNINEEAKRKATGKTICFLPHCDLPLYNNLLWANWDKETLSDIAIIGNSFQNYEMNDVKSQLQAKAKYVCIANQFISEIKMKNSFRFTDIFNDLAIHYFKSSSLSATEPFVWSDVTEPEYTDDDIIKQC